MSASIRRGVRIAAIALLSLGSVGATAEEAQIRYYDIAGSDERELRRELDAKGPIGKRGHSVDGRTEWKVSWHFRYAPANGGCVLTRINVTARGVITLPRWNGAASADGALARKWRGFVDALRRHEDGHYAHALQAADEIEELGRSFRVSTRCSTIEQAFNGQANLILEKYRAADVAFDARTRHGRTEGVRFP